MIIANVITTVSLFRRVVSGVVATFKMLFEDADVIQYEDGDTMRQE